MKEPIKITNSQQYKELIQSFTNALIQKIPDTENATIQVSQPRPEETMEFGTSCVLVTLITDSSGVDKYIIFVDNFNHARFIRWII